MSYVKLLKSVPTNDDDFDKLKQASQLAVDLIRSINDEVGKKDDLKRLEWLDEQVNGASSYVRLDSKGF